jgi:hypothetical protein
VSDASAGPGWWIASDGKWYPPHLHPQIPSPPPADSFSGSPGAVYGRTGPEPSAFSGLPGFPPLAPSGGNLGYGYPGSYGYARPPSIWGPPGDAYGFPTSQPTTNGLAVASLILSIVWLFGIGSILGIIFGFVSRGQIERSRGAQRGDGMAMAGIIVGFITLVLALLVAIPTFVGVKAASNDRTDQSVTHLPLTPIVLGQPIEGGSAAPVPWQSQSISGATLVAVPSGVTMSISSPGQAQWAGVPNPGLYQSMQLTANVAITAGPMTNSIGLACITPSRSEQLVFVIFNSGLWRVEMLSNQGASVIDSGVTSAIHPTGSNTLAIACGNEPARPGSTHIQFAINQTPVSNDIADFSFTEWIPALQLCSCDGPSTGSFQNVAYFGSSSASSP